MKIKRNGKIVEIIGCPFCNYNEFYVVTIMRGKGATYYKYDGTEGCNGDMHDCLKYTEQKTMYCGDCQEKIGYLL